MATEQELLAKIEAMKEEVAEAYMDGVKASRQFDESMDTFLVNFLRKPYSSIVVFAIAAGLLFGGIYIGTFL